MKKQGFFVIFLSLVALRLRGPDPLGHPHGYAYNFLSGYAQKIGRQHSGCALFIFIIGSISNGGLCYRLCYSIKFIITLNEGLGLQLLGQNT